MMAVRVNCPFCDKGLKFRQAPAPGRRVLCTGCDRSFPVQAHMVQSITLAPTPAPVAPAPIPDRRPLAPLPSSVLTPLSASPSMPAPPPPAQPHREMIIGAVVTGLVVMVVLTGLGLFLATRFDRRKATIVGGPMPPAPVGGQKQAPIAPDDPRPAQPGELPPALRPGDGGRPVPPRIDAPAPPADRGGLPRELQEHVNKAIDRGVEHLKKKQLVNGTWENSHTTGLAALPALTMLECGVPASDDRVQKAARFVRSHAAKIDHRSTTYEVSLALLFLDRLGAAQDKPLIRTLALRLVGGQLPDGGWTYTLPLITQEEERQIAGFLSRTRPPRELEGFVHKKPSEDRKLDLPAARKDRGRDIDRGVMDGGSKPGDGGAKPGGNTKGIDGEKPGKQGEPPLNEAERKKAREQLPERLRDIPAVGDAVGSVPPMNRLVLGQADNSNTQFATLALWAAKKHDLPLERSLGLLAKRFRTSQVTDGTWKYQAQHQGWGTPAMTGAGLLGLAVGHGITSDPTKKATIKDEQIDKGLKALGAHVGKPLGSDKAGRLKVNKGGFQLNIGRHQSPINLYFLWTVERVGVLYGVREMDGKDWYHWGVEQLLPTQGDDGSWHQGNYHGSTRCVDTCFALLFLKRANLASDLSGRLDFMVEGKPAAK